MQTPDAPTPITRRRLLGNAARLAALGAAASILPANLRRALADAAPAQASLRDIKHIVLLMQENRSFDHYFGTMAGVRGFDDPNALILPSGKSVFHQPDPLHPAGYLLPFHLDTRTSSAQKIPSTNHSWPVQHDAWNGGRMDNWLPAHRKVDKENAPYVMGYHTRDDIPFQFALAEAFTLCDAYHCSMMGPTGPNRTIWMTGTIDPEGRLGGPKIGNNGIDGGYRWTTYAERLEQAGISWKVYQQEDNYGCNLLEFFANFINAPEGSPLHTRGMLRGPEDAFEQDARNDRLPTVSWIIPASYQSEHPDYMPAAGAAFVASKLDAIASNPEVWAKTVFILNYDENDGIFDHVVPPTPPPGTPLEFVHGLPIGAGFRVPCIIVSPWTAGGWVCGQQFDHTSILQFVEKVTGVKEPNITPWRRQTFGDLTSAFRFTDPAENTPPNLPDTSAHLLQARLETLTLPKPPIPTSDQSAPVQEKGDRKRVPPVVG
jgi:phospholipase C